MPKVKKLISSLKCQRCRHDRQKCLPEFRDWSGNRESRCDRCKKYNYDCSANRTRAEEKADLNDVDLASTQEIRRPTIPHVGIFQRLQELQDFRRLNWVLCNTDIPGLPDGCQPDVADRLSQSETALQCQAEQLMRDCRHRDAENIMGQMIAQFKEVGMCVEVGQNWRNMPRMVRLYEKMGHLPLAEAYQETILLNFNDLIEDDPQYSGHFLSEVERLHRFYTLFYLRTKELDFADSSMMADVARVAIFRRAALLETQEVNDRIMKNDEIGLPPFPLHLAVHIGAKKMTETLVDRFRYDVNSRNNDGPTPVHVAIENDQWKILQILVNAKADLELTLRTGVKALHLAVAVGSIACARVLLDAGADLDARCRDGKTALHHAIGDYSEEMTRLMLDAGADLEAMCNEGKTALHYAASGENEKILRLLHNAGAFLRAKCKQGKEALHYATEEGSEEIMRLLIQLSPCLEVQCNVGRTALLYAAYSGDLGKVVLLLDAGADVNARDRSGTTALIAALECMGFQSAEIIRRLLFARARPYLEAQTESGMTALLTAARNGDAATVRLLIEKGANPQARTNNRETAFHLALSALSIDDSGSYNEVIMTLIRSHVDKDVLNMNGETALLIAVKHQLFTALRMLLDHGAETFCNDIWGWSPLSLAVRNGDHESVQALLDHDASIELAFDRNKYCGNTLLHFAIRRSTPTIVKLLLEAGADPRAKGFEGNTVLYDTILYTRGQRRNLFLALLAHHGVDICSQDDSGNTLLHLAVSSNSPQMVETILHVQSGESAQRNLGIVNNQGLTPMTMLNSRA